MIPAGYGTAFFIYLLIWLVIVGILWLRETLRSDIKSWSRSEGRLCLCDSCKNIFLATPQEINVHCPKCHKLCNVKITKYKKGR